MKLYLITSEAITLFQTKFNGGFILQRGNNDWPSRSCNLTSFVFPLRDNYLKQKVYVNIAITIVKLKENIRCAIAATERFLCERGKENFVTLMKSWRTLDRYHISNVTAEFELNTDSNKIRILQHFAFYSVIFKLIFHQFIPNTSFYRI